MKRTCLVTLLLAFTALSVLGEPPNQDSGSRQKKEPWELSTEERFAAMHDPAFIKANSRTAEQSYGSVGAEGITGHPILIRRGDRNPESFFPFEIFNSLMSGLDDGAVATSVTRLEVEAGVASLGYKSPEAFWREIERLAHAHVVLRRQSAALSAQLDSADRKQRDELMAQIGKLQVPLCRSRSEAIAALRTRFGREAFDRFLYTVIATHMNSIQALTTNETAAEYARIEGGCQ